MFTTSNLAWVDNSTCVLVLVDHKSPPAEKYNSFSEQEPTDDST